MPGDRATLGQLIFTDRNLSEPRGIACAACHQPNMGFAGNNGSLSGVTTGSKLGQEMPALHRSMAWATGWTCQAELRQTFQLC